VRFSGRIRRGLGILFAIIFIAGCAIKPRASGPFDENISRWSGRLALKVLSTPVQAFSADFELQGSAQEGLLTFTTPLGSTLARLRWDAAQAVLQTTGEPQQFDSLNALTRHATGTDIPVASLFDWLRGRTVDTPGWDADLTDLAAGRITARRSGPDVAVELKIILDR
jgi:outer membrane lipoprotein LolB